MGAGNVGQGPGVLVNILKKQPGLGGGVKRIGMNVGLGIRLFADGTGKDGLQ